MSSKPYTIQIDDVEKRVSGDINITWDIYTIATWDTVQTIAELYSGFEPINITRGGEEIFSGRLEVFRPSFGVDGRPMPLSGFDDTVRLRDYITPLSTTIAGTSTVASLGSILVNTPFDISTSGTFGYIDEDTLKTWDTWLEAVLEIEVYDDVTPTVTITNGPDVSDVVNAGTWTGCVQGLKSTFFYDGVTQRFYIFVKNATNDLWYYHSPDGDTWTGVDTGYNPSGDYWSVAWYASKVYLFIYDGVNTDFYRGTINDGTGVITFGVSTANIFANQVKFGPVFDDSGHIWVLRNSGGGNAYESTDDGATWGSVFTVGSNELHAILPVGSDGDIYGFELDTVNSDLEEWYWDRSAGTYVFTNKITDEDDVDAMDGCCDAAYNWYITWVDIDSTNLYMATMNGGIASVLVNGNVINTVCCICSDGYYAYMTGVTAGGTQVYKYYEDDQLETVGTGAYTQPIYASSPRGYLQDGMIAVYFTIIHSSDFDPYFVSFPLSLWRLVEDETDGFMRSDAVAQGVGFTDWGLCLSTGDADYITETEWSVLDSANAVLVSGQSPDFDIRLAGILSSEASIKIYIDFDGLTLDPELYEFSVSQRLDVLVLEVDGENTYDAVGRLAELSGAEFWVVDDGDGTYTVYFSTRRGEDKSSYVILKCATTSDEPDTMANIKVLNRTFDATDYANSIQFIGGLDGLGSRVEVTAQDYNEITSRGQEYWYTLRDAEVTTEAMGQTRAYLELLNRNSIIERIEIEFIDEHVSNTINIGDSVYVIGEWRKNDLKIDGSYRIVQLRRSWGRDGERVSAMLSNRLKYAQYYNYTKKISDLERVSTM